MSEKEQEMTSKKLGLHVGDSFQDTREIREVLDKSVFREEEPTHSQQTEVLEEPVALDTSESISDAEPAVEAGLEPVTEPKQEPEQEAEQPLSRMSRRSRKAGVEAAKVEASKVEEDTEELEADVAVEPIRRQSKRPVPLAIPFVLSLLISLRNQWSALLCNQLVGKFRWWTLDLDDSPSDCPLFCGDLSLSGCALAGVR